MAGKLTLTVFLGFSIYMMGIFPVTYCRAFSNAFIPLKSKSNIRIATNEQQEQNSPSAGNDWEQMEETFVASSAGEGMEVIDMIQHEDSEGLRNSAVKDLVLDLALALSTGSIVLFFNV